MSRPLQLTFLKSAPRHQDLPPMRAEVAVLGRSNVGKSSLINALAKKQGLAKVSSTPGRTRLLNVFALDQDTAVVDCPGYGYAQAAKTDRRAWMGMVSDYLVERDPLKLLILLVDGLVGPTALDQQIMDELRDMNVPFKVVATKHDKVKPSQRQKRKKEVAAGCELPPAEILWVSAKEGTGITELRQLVREVLSAGHVS